MLRSFKNNLADSRSTAERNCAPHVITAAKTSAGAVSGRDGNILAVALKLAFLVAIIVAVAGCQSEEQFINYGALLGGGTATNVTTHFEKIILREGDVVRITFPSAGDLNTTTPIRRDGNITLKLVGDVRAVGLTPEELKETLLKLYAGQVDTKEVTVELVSSTFPVFVVGAVVRPGKVLTDHPITALECVMEQGGFDFTKANLKNVTVLRQDAGHLKTFTLNMRDILDGKVSEQFYMKPEDIIYVREKFAWF